MLVAATGLITPSRPHTHVHPHHCGPVTAHSFAKFSGEVWDQSRWHRPQPSPFTIRAEIKKLQCARGTGIRHYLQARWRKDQRAFYKHRAEKREQLRYLPYDCGGGVRSAIDCGVMLCESGGSYTAKNRSSTAGGKYQIIDSTWYRYGGGHYGADHPAAYAPPAEQDRIASAIWAGGAGRSQWSCA